MAGLGQAGMDADTTAVVAAVSSLLQHLAAHQRQVKIKHYTVQVHLVIH